MSADNGIYIAKFPDGFRVCHEQAIENVWYHRKGTKARKKMLKSYFGDSPIFKTKEKAIFYAHKLEEKVLSDFDGILEYGVCYLGEYESFI